MTNCREVIFESNSVFTSAADSGGAIYVENLRRLFILSNHFNGSKSQTDGGVLFVDTVRIMKLVNNSISYCQALEEGGFAKVNF